MRSTGGPRFDGLLMFAAAIAAIAVALLSVRLLLNSSPGNFHIQFARRRLKHRRRRGICSIIRSRICSTPLAPQWSQLPPMAA